MKEFLRCPCRAQLSKATKAARSEIARFLGKKKVLQLTRSANWVLFREEVSPLHRLSLDVGCPLSPDSKGATHVGVEGVEGSFRERLRAAVLRLESGSLPGDAFLAELDMLLKKHPQRTSLSRKNSEVVLDVFFEPEKPDDVWSPIVAATAELLSQAEPSGIRKCESDSCVVHFYDTSKKGSRRWCSMNICGNRLKVAAYQSRRRLA